MPSCSSAYVSRASYTASIVASEIRAYSGALSPAWLFRTKDWWKQRVGTRIVRGWGSGWREPRGKTVMALVALVLAIARKEWRRVESIVVSGYGTMPGEGVEW